MRSSKASWRLLLAAFTIATLGGKAQTPLTTAEATGVIQNYDGPIQKALAVFPAAVSNSPEALTSMGPTPISENCYTAWRQAFKTLQEKGYLSSFEESQEGMGIETEQLTKKGHESFSRLTPQSIYFMVKIASSLKGRAVEVTSVEQQENEKDALVQFRFRPSEAFLIMWKSDLFTPECRAEVDPTVIRDEMVRGHAHFRRSRDRWGIEDLLMGDCKPKE